MVLMGAWSHWLIVGVTLAAVETSTGNSFLTLSLYKALCDMMVSRIGECCKGLHFFLLRLPYGSV